MRYIAYLVLRGGASMVAVATPEFVDTLAEVLPDANGGMLPSVDPGMAGTGDDAALLDPFAPDAAATESVDEAVAFDPTVMRQQVAAEMLAAHELQLAQLRSTKDREVHQHKLMAEVATGELGQVYQWLEGAAKQAMEHGQPIMLDPEPYAADCPAFATGRAVPARHRSPASHGTRGGRLPGPAPRHGPGVGRGVGSATDIPRRLSEGAR